MADPKGSAPRDWSESDLELSLRQQLQSERDKAEQAARNADNQQLRQEVGDNTTNQYR